MKIGIASDHRGFNKKTKIKKYLAKKGYEIVDYGTDSIKSTDYPQYAFKLGEAVAKKEVEYGVVICSTGIGVSIAANKVKQIRCAKVNNANEAKMAKKHNNANMLAFGNNMYMFIIKDMLDKFFETEAETNEKYINRNQQIADYEAKK